jgi:hypothetical protein
MNALLDLASQVHGQGWEKQFAGSGEPFLSPEYL